MQLIGPKHPLFERNKVHELEDAWEHSSWPQEQDTDLSKTVVIQLIPSSLIGSEEFHNQSTSFPRPNLLPMDDADLSNNCRCVVGTYFCSVTTNKDW